MISRRNFLEITYKKGNCMKHKRQNGYSVIMEKRAEKNAKYNKKIMIDAGINF